MNTPSIEQWLIEAKQDPNAQKCGMYLFHNGVVRQTSKQQVRCGDLSAPDVSEMLIAFDSDRVERARLNALEMDGIYSARVWINSGRLKVGDDIMLVLIGGDIRPRVIDALNYLVCELKTNCISEKEIYE